MLPLGRQTAQHIFNDHSSKVLLFGWSQEFPSSSEADMRGELQTKMRSSKFVQQINLGPQAEDRS